MSWVTKGNFLCTRMGCNEKSYCVLIYGCLNQHVREAMYCFNHGNEWAADRLEKKIKCSGCHGLIEEFEVLYMEDLIKNAH